MAESGQVVVEAVGAAVLDLIAERFTSSNSALATSLLKLTEPPDDVHVLAERQYTGLVLIVKNEVKRALVFEHRRHGGPPADHSPERDRYAPVITTTADFP